MKKSGNDPLIKYESLIKIFINHESLLADLLDFIIISDDNCDSTILHRFSYINQGVLNYI